MGWEQTAQSAAGGWLSTLLEEFWGLSVWVWGGSGAVAVPWDPAKWRLIMGVIRSLKQSTKMNSLGAILK